MITEKDYSEAERRQEIADDIKMCSMTKPYKRADDYVDELEAEQMAAEYDAMTAEQKAAIKNCEEIPW